jgi:hypothetical protein
LASSFLDTSALAKLYHEESCSKYAERIVSLGIPAEPRYDDEVTSFTVEARTQLKARLLEFANHDPRLSGAAVTGSAAAGREDRWSDIDLAFGVADPALVGAVLSDFSDFMSAHGSIYHHDVRAGAWIYRVFFLPGGLQVDLAFVEQGEFRPLGPAFQLVSGDAKPIQPFPPPNPKDIIGLAWLHALHARSCILRDKLWQAEYMVSAVRDHTLALACIRLGQPSAHGRGMDSLPESVTRPLLESMIRHLSSDELWRAFDAVLGSLTSEVNQADPALGLRVSRELSSLSCKPPA